MSSGESPQGHIHRKRAVRYHTRLISEYYVREAGREDASQSIIFKFFIHRSGVIPMGESGAGSGEQVKYISLELDTANLIYSLKSELVQSLGKDINKVFSVPCGRFMSRLKCIYLVKSTRKGRGHFSKIDDGLA